MIDKLKQIIRFLTKRPQKHIICHAFLKLWLIIGVIYVADVLYSNYIRSKPPVYSELTCQRGVYVEKGVRKVAKDPMKYIELEISEDNRKKYFNGDPEHVFNFLDGLLDQQITVCYYPSYTGYTKYNRYVEVIYQDKRLMNTYEARREFYLNNIEKSKEVFWLTIIFWVLLPLSLFVYILKKY